MPNTTHRIGSTGVGKLQVDMGTAPTDAPTAGHAYGDAVGVYGAPESLSPNGTQADQALTVDATVGGVQFAAFDAATSHVFWDCQAAEVSVTFDGSAPTTTNGHLIEAGDSGSGSV